VYVIRRRQDYQRRVGESDILYVGSAVNQQGLKIRIRQYFHPGPTQRTNKRILALIADSAEFELAYVEAKSIPEAKTLEATILDNYERDHAELPPENKRH
jgi:hypothetical protein